MTYQGLDRGWPRVMMVLSREPMVVVVVVVVVDRFASRRPTPSSVGIGPSPRSRNNDDSVRLHGLGGPAGH